ncbi:MAG: hypothetical protein NTW87_24065, partial [Planctomycetota bacterium]|nr:hypothetical protein [Planctomycetota bacterium]
SPGTGYVVAVEPTSKLAGDAAEGPGLRETTPWIWTPEGAQVAACAFRKVLDLPDKPAKASVLITCDNGYTLTVNGKKIGTGSQWERVQVYDVASALRSGKNVIAVAAVNTGDSAGLIVELRLGEGAGSTVVTSDASWRCSTSPTGDWLRPEFDDATWKPVTVISAFGESLWYRHPIGPPKVEAAGTPASGATFGTLAMRWHGADGVLPFDVRPTDAKPAGWYRFRTAPGTKTMTVSARGRVECWVNGTPCRREDLGGGRSRFHLSEPTKGEAAAALRIEQERGLYGGAALPEPVSFECVAGQVRLGDWSRMESLESYSGGLWYRKTIALAADQVKGHVVLDLGNVVSSAEVHVNGQPAGARVAPPWRWDVTKLVRPGENSLEVLVYSTLGNHYTTIPTRYRGSVTAGLLGPVRIEVPAADEQKPR